MPPPAPPRSRRGFKVAIICTLPLEAEYVRSVFDKCWEDEDKQYDKVEGDQNTYTTGVIGKHNVVLAYMPYMGSLSASAAAAGLRSSFPGIQLSLVVGICGAVPMHPKTQEEIVLGDIVVSTAVVQYEFGRQYPQGLQRKKEIEDSLGRSSPEMRSFIQMLQVRQNQKRLTRNLALLLRSEHFQKKIPAFRYPGAIRDRLYEASYIHQHRAGVSCSKCENLEICSQSCDEVGCEIGKLVLRNRHSFPKTKDLALHPDDAPFIHFGRFGSMKTMMKSGTDRDRLAQSDQVIAFGMEGAELWDLPPTVVIKAACDYADGHKDEDWQVYAATTAAGCLEVFLKEWRLPDQLADEDELSTPVWHVPFDRMLGFVGRTDVLAHLHQVILASDKRRIASIFGLGGMGKSRLALELAYQIHSDHPEYSIFWIEATDQLTFERDVFEIGKKLKIPGIEDNKADAGTLVKQHLSNSADNRWLLILDNADDEAIWEKKSQFFDPKLSLVDWLPSTTNGSILITTRSRLVASYLARNEVTELQALSVDEAREMITNTLVKPELAADRDAILVLPDKLTYLPLAIIQATSFMNMTQQPVKNYLDLMGEAEEEVVKLLSEDFADPSRYSTVHNSVSKTWLISFRQIHQYHPLAAQFLSSMACLHEENIPLSLLPDIGSKKDVVDAIATLVGYSFVMRQTRDGVASHHEPLYDMHRLVHFAARNWLKIEGSLAEWTKVCIMRAAELFPARDHQHKHTWAVYLPHAQRLCDNREANDLPERYCLLEKIGLWFVVDAKYTEAVKAHTAVLQWRENNLGLLDQQTLCAYNNLGEALNLRGDFSSAERYLEKALQGQKESLGAKHPDTLTTMSNLASTYRNQGRWKEAEKLGVQVMEMRKELLGEEHPDTLTSISNLASTLWNQGQWAEAEKLELQMTETRIRVLGVDHPDTLISIANLASMYRNQGRLTQAEELGTQVMRARKRVLGPEHHSTLISMVNLASTFRNQGRWTEAEELEVQVMDTFKRVLGPEHPDTLTSMANLASTFRNQGRWTQAEELEVQVVDTCKRVLGPEHPDTLTSMANLASTFRNQGRWTQAEELEVQVVDMCKRVLGPEHPYTLTSMANLASTFWNQGRWTQAKELGAQVMETRNRVLGAKHPDTLTSIYDLALWTRPTPGHSLSNVEDTEEQRLLMEDISNPDERLPQPVSDFQQTEAFGTDDIQSLISDTDDIQSHAPGPSSSPLAQGAISHITNLLARNVDLAPVFNEALNRLERRHFIDNFRKLLRNYYKDLLVEARTDVERTIAGLLRTRWSRIHIATEIVEQMRPETQASVEHHNKEDERLKEVLPMIENWIQNHQIDTDLDGKNSRQMHQENNNLEVATNDSPQESGDEDDQSEENSDYHFLNIGQVEDFLTKKEPFRKFAKNIAMFLLPPSYASLTRTIMSLSIDRIWFSDREDTSYTNMIKVFLEDITDGNWDWWPLRPAMRPLRDGEIRLHWCCHCDTHMWMGVPTGVAETYKLILKTRSNPTENTHLCAIKKEVSKIRRTPATYKPIEFSGDQPSGIDIKPEPRSTSQQVLDNASNNHQTDLSIQQSPSQVIMSAGFGIPMGHTNIRDLYILFGVSGKLKTLSLTQISRGECNNDDLLLSILKKYNREQRGFWKYWLSVWKFDYCHFVKFQKVRPNRIISRGQGLPTDALYEYELIPPDAGFPPIDEHEFRIALSACRDICWLSYLHDCVESFTGDDIIKRIPKRKYLFETETSQQEFAWGIQARYSISNARVISYHFFIFVGTFVFWIAWQIRHPDDIQTAAVPITTIATMLSLFWTTSGCMKLFKDDM